MRTQYFNLNLVPGTVGPVVHLSQYDEDEDALVFTIYNGSVLLDMTGMTAVIEGTKPDSTGFSYYGTVSGNTATFDVTDQMTVLSGQFAVEVRIDNGTDNVGTINMLFDIEKAALDSGTDISETELPSIIARAQAEQAAAAASAAAAAASETNAAASESAAAESEENAEAWAVGQRGGVDVDSTDDTYQNNSKYYATQAGTSATNAATSEANAAASETNAAASEANAATSETNAATSETNAAASATAAAASATAAADSADEAQDIADAMRQYGVSSFNSRTGAVIPVSGDYPASLVPATDTEGLLGTAAATVTAQVLLDALAEVSSMVFNNHYYAYLVDESGNYIVDDADNEILGDWAYQIA